MEYTYEKLMAEHNLTLEELPQDAKIGIDSIAQIKKAINLAEKTGKKIKQSIHDKLKANDKWVAREILDYVQDKKTNKEPLPNPAPVVVKEIQDTPPVATTEPVKTDPAATTEPATEPVAEPANKAEGAKVDAELEALFKEGKTTLTLDEVKSRAKTAYNLIFEAYTTGEQNGVETDKYSLLEGEKEVFTLTKK